MNIAIEFWIFELVQVPNFKINWQFWFFEPNLPKNGICGRNRKSKHNHWILHIRMGRKQPHFPGGDSLVYLAEPMHKKCSITFVWGHHFSTWTQVPNFKINWQFWLFGPIYPKMVFAVEIKKVNITTKFCIFQWEENNHIFIAGGDSLVYLAEPMHKKCSTTFVWGHPFSTYVSYDRC